MVIKQNINKDETKQGIYTYVLKLDGKRFYTGITNNIERRLREHRSRNKGYTSKYNKKELIFLYLSEDRKKARKLEIKIKRYNAKRFLMRNIKSIKKDKNTKYINEILVTNNKN